MSNTVTCGPADAELFNDIHLKMLLKMSGQIWDLAEQTYPPIEPEPRYDYHVDLKSRLQWKVPDTKPPYEPHEEETRRRVKLAEMKALSEARVCLADVTVNVASPHVPKDLGKALREAIDVVYTSA